MEDSAIERANFGYRFDRPASKTRRPADSVLRITLMRTLLLALLVSTPVLAQGGPALVDVAKAEQIETALSRRFVGAIRPKRISVVGAESGGRIAEYKIREGMRVEAGSVLAVIDKKPQELLINAKKAQIRFAKAAILELRNGSRPEEVDQAKAAVAREEADIELRRYRHEKAMQLFRNETISEDEVKLALFELRAAEARLKSAVAALTLAEKGPRPERILAAEAQIEIREAELAQLEDDLERHTARAPFTGYVVQTNTELGERVNVGDPLMTIVELDEIEAVLPVPNDAANRLRAGTEVTVVVPSLPAKEQRFQGTIVAIVPRAEERGRTLPVKVRIKNVIKDGVPRLKAGALAVGILPVGDPVPTLLVPTDAIVLGGPSPTVWVVSAENTVCVGSLDPGADHQLTVDGQVVHHMAPGERVVIARDPRPMGLVRMPGQSFFRTMQRKLNWAVRSPERA